MHPVVELVVFHGFDCHATGGSVPTVAASIPFLRFVPGAKTATDDSHAKFVPR